MEVETLQVLFNLLLLSTDIFSLRAGRSRPLLTNTLAELGVSASEGVMRRVLIYVLAEKVDLMMMDLPRRTWKMRRRPNVDDVVLVSEGRHTRLHLLRGSFLPRLAFARALIAFGRRQASSLSHLELVP